MEDKPSNISKSTKKALNKKCLGERLTVLNLGGGEGVTLCKPIKNYKPITTDMLVTIVFCITTANLYTNLINLVGDFYERTALH